MSEQHVEPTPPEFQPKATLRRNKSLKGNGQDQSSPVEVIPDPGTHHQSKYASRPTFAGTGAILVHVPVILNKPKSFCRSFPDLMVPTTLVDLARPKETGKRLHLITPEAVEAGALDNLPEAFEAVSVPFLDRYGVPFLWSVRQCTRDGIELESFGAAMKVIEDAATEWLKFWWVSPGYQEYRHPHPERLNLAVPSTLKTPDDWIEAGYVGKIIRDADDDRLAEMRGDK